MLDCAEPDRLAEFWAAALGYQDVGGAGSYRMLLPADGGPGPQLLLQRVPEPKASKLRMHLDIHTPDIEAEAARVSPGSAPDGSPTRQSRSTAAIGCSWRTPRATSSACATPVVTPAESRQSASDGSPG